MLECLILVLNEVVNNIITERLNERALARNQQQYETPRVDRKVNHTSPTISSITNPTGLGPNSSQSGSPPVPPHVSFSEDSKIHDGITRDPTIDSAEFFSAEAGLVETPAVAIASIETNNSTIVPSVASGAYDSPSRVGFSDESKTCDSSIDSTAYFSAVSSLSETSSVANASIETNNSSIVPSVTSGADANTTVAEDFGETVSSNDATA